MAICSSSSAVTDFLPCFDRESIASIFLSVFLLLATVRRSDSMSSFLILKLGLFRGVSVQPMSIMTEVPRAHLQKSLFKSILISVVPKLRGIFDSRSLQKICSGVSCVYYTVG